MKTSPPFLSGRLARHWANLCNIRNIPGILAGVSLLCAPHAGAKIASEYSISQVVENSMSGLPIAGDGDLKAQGQEFIRLRRGKLSERHRMQWIASCLSHPASNPYCKFLPETRKSKGGSSESDSASMDPTKVVELLRAGNVNGLKEVSEGSMIRAMRSFGSFEQLEKIRDASLKARSCPSTALLTGLGIKSEEYYPEQRFKEQARALYSRSIACGSITDESAYKARYRLSLLDIWDGRCKEADSNLAFIADRKDGDFASRGLYWRVHCAEARGNKLLAAALQGRLQRDFPLSFHGMVLGKRPARELLKYFNSSEPKIRLTSESSPSINASLRAIEMLQRLRAYDLALDGIDAVAEDAESAEVGVRLYVAVLAKRSGDAIGKFKLLASIFRDNPSAISRSTMELFYPLQRFDTIQKLGSKIDPFLVTALIRQESGFNERARSPAGAMGLMQLMPNTARRMERVSRRELYDPKTNIRLGVRYFNGLLSRFGADVELALAAYNAGPEKVDDWKRRYTTTNRMLFLDMIPFPETRNYVALIVRNYLWYLSLYGEKHPRAQAGPVAKIVTLRRK